MRSRPSKAVGLNRRRQAAFKLTSTLSIVAVNEIQFAYSANRIKVDPGAGEDINRQINQAIPGFYP
jgi:hypothetical protein